MVILSQAQGQQHEGLGHAKRLQARINRIRHTRSGKDSAWYELERLVGHRHWACNFWFNSHTESNDDDIFDITAKLASMRLAELLSSMLTPQLALWISLAVENGGKRLPSRIQNQLSTAERHIQTLLERSNFYSFADQVYRDLVVYGTSHWSMFEQDGGLDPVFYSWPIEDVWVLSDAYARPCGHVAEMYRTAYEMFTLYGDDTPVDIMNAVNNNEDTMYRCGILCERRSGDSGYIRRKYETVHYYYNSSVIINAQQNQDNNGLGKKVDNLVVIKTSQSDDDFIKTVVWKNEKSSVYGMAPGEYIIPTAAALNSLSEKQLLFAQNLVWPATYVPAEMMQVTKDILYQPGAQIPYMNPNRVPRREPINANNMQMALQDSFQRKEEIHSTFYNDSVLQEHPEHEQLIMRYLAAATSNITNDLLRPAVLMFVRAVDKNRILLPQGVDARIVVNGPLHKILKRIAFGEEYSLMTNVLQTIGAIDPQSLQLIKARELMEEVFAGMGKAHLLKSKQEIEQIAAQQEALANANAEAEISMKQARAAAGQAAAEKKSSEAQGR